MTGTADSLEAHRPKGDRRIDPHIFVHIGPEPLDAGAALDFVSAPEAGGSALFRGTVRSPNAGEVVDHLDYEVWEERVTDTLVRIASETKERFGATRVWAAHRTGRVDVGAASVICAVSAPHRAEAFDACRHLIDTLKETAPIWKKEVTQDTERWVGAGS